MATWRRPSLRIHRSQTTILRLYVVCLWRWVCLWRPICCRRTCRRSVALETRCQTSRWRIACRPCIWKSFSSHRSSRGRVGYERRSMRWSLVHRCRLAGCCLPRRTLGLTNDARKVTGHHILLGVCWSVSHCFGFKDPLYTIVDDNCRFLATHSIFGRDSSNENLSKSVYDVLRWHPSRSRSWRCGVVRLSSVRWISWVVWLRLIVTLS